MITLKTKKDINRFRISGRLISIIYKDDFSLITIENYTNNETIMIPIWVNNNLRQKPWSLYEYLEIHGFLESTEVSPHEYVYRLEATNVYPASPDNHTNEFIGYAYLAQPPRILNNVHPYTATLYLGSASFYENGIFFGNRFKFNIILLRKNINLAENINVGDVISFKCSITHTESHGIQLVGKEIIPINYLKMSKQIKDEQIKKPKFKKEKKQQEIYNTIRELA